MSRSSCACGKGLPCLQIRVGSVTKALQPPLDALLQNAKFPQFSGTNSVVQNNALLLLHSALASNRLDIRGLLTISRYMWCNLDVLLVFLRLAIAFEQALFPGLPIGCLTIFSLSVDLKEATTQSSVLYNTAEVVCQGRHLTITRTHHADGCCFFFFCFPLHCLDSMSECWGRTIRNTFMVSVDKYFDACKHNTVDHTFYE